MHRGSSGFGDGFKFCIFRKRAARSYGLLLLVMEFGTRCLLSVAWRNFCVEFLVLDASAFLYAQFAARHGLGGLLKDGYRTFTGIDEVTAKNIEACKTLTDLTKTSLGAWLPHFSGGRFPCLSLAIPVTCHLACSSRMQQSITGKRA